MNRFFDELQFHKHQRSFLTIIDMHGMCRLFGRIQAQVRMAQQEKQDNSTKKEDEEDPILAELKKRLGTFKKALEPYYRSVVLQSNTFFRIKFRAQPHLEAIKRNKQICRIRTMT